MAEGSVTALQRSQVPAMAPELSSSLTEEERRQVEECQKILQFQDRVLSGAHPSIKVLSHLFAPKQGSGSRNQVSVPSTASAQASSFSQGAKGQTPNGFGKPPPKGPKLSRANAAMPTNGTGPQSAANLRSFNANAARAATSQKHANAVQPPGLDASSSTLSAMAGIPTGPRADAGKRASDSSANAQFDPVLLTKSEDLIKAEFHLQRQRMERTLADAVQQHRAATKAASTIEPAVDFDLASVLMQGLLRAQSSALPQTHANLAANPSRSESDSNATFYSSKHDTPESHLEQRIPGSDEAEAVQDRDDSPYEPPMVMDATPISGPAPVITEPPSTASNSFVNRHVTESRHQPVNAFAQPTPSFANVPSHAATYDVLTTHTSLQGRNATSGGKSTAQEANGAPIEILSSQESGGGSSSRNSGAASADQPSAQSRLESATRQMIEQAFGRHQSPILRAHNLSPIAPQPAHVSPLATSRQPPVPRQDASQGQATSAQIAALRADHSNGSSPDSSPQGKASRKGKKNNKKRKADRMAANNAPALYIKPEPRSPSPLTAPQYSRQSNKRMRSAQQQIDEHGTNEPRHEEVVESAHPFSYPPRFHRDDRGPAYGSSAVPSTPQDARVIVIPESPRYERQYPDEPRPVRYIRRASPGAQSYSHPPAEVRTYRSVSRAAIDPPSSYHDPRDQPRTVIRPAADRERSRSPILIEDRAPSAMAPPPLPAARVFLDEFGREYIEPPSRQESVVVRRSVASRPVYGDRETVYEPSRATSRIVRRSVAPSSVHGEPEFIHERAPPARAVSVMPGSIRYDEEAVYRAPTSQAVYSPAGYAPAGYSPAGYSPAGYSPAGHTTTRRVVARPEYAPEYRYYRERDYPPQPAAQLGAGEYYTVYDTRPPVSEQQQQYVVRYTTARPESPGRPEAVRMSSVRPEPVAGEYGAPIRIDTQAMPPPRSYSVRPMAPPPPPQQGQYARQWAEYEARPEYESRPAYSEQIRVEDDDVTHVDTVPREVYR